MDALLPELLRYSIQFLPLTTLIAARRVSREWRTLVLTASHPARKALLGVYLAAVVHPNFQSLVEALQPHVREFDREAYIAKLKSRGCVLPDVFELWVLEWPPKAVYFWAWPGIERTARNDVDHENYYFGNMVGSDSEPTMGVIPVPKKDMATAGSRKCRGLAVYRVNAMDSVARCELWLVVDSNERINDREGGRLVWTVARCSGEHVENRCIFGVKKIFHDRLPFGPTDADFKMVDFLNSLEFSERQIMENVVEGLYSGMPPTMEDSDDPE